MNQKTFNIIYNFIYKIFVNNKKSFYNKIIFLLKFNY